ncbi:hypothetical protein ACFL4G_08480 [Thermodesulfobacteriota bacterium]
MKKQNDTPNLDWKSLLVLACCASLAFPSCAVPPDPKQVEFLENQLIVYDDYYDGYIGILSANLNDRYHYIVRDELGCKVKSLDEAQRYYLKYYRGWENRASGSRGRSALGSVLAATQIIIFPVYIVKMLSSISRRGDYKDGLDYLEEGRNREAIEAFKRALKIETKKSEKEARRILREKRRKETLKKARRITEEEAQEASESVNPEATWLRNGTDIHFRLGQAYDRSGDTSSALEHYHIFLDYSTGVNRFPYCGNPRPSGRLPELFLIAGNRIKELEMQGPEFPLP